MPTKEEVRTQLMDDLSQDPAALERITDEQLEKRSERRKFYESLSGEEREQLAEIYRPSVYAMAVLPPAFVVYPKDVRAEKVLAPQPTPWRSRSRSMNLSFGGAATCKAFQERLESGPPAASKAETPEADEGDGVEDPDGEGSVKDEL
eukprot:scaffold7885_cov403-Prasinococcus_capsulatus_cf.AAC.9